MEYLIILYFIYCNFVLFYKILLININTVKKWIRVYACYPIRMRKRQNIDLIEFGFGMNFSPNENRWDNETRMRYALLLSPIVT